MIKMTDFYILLSGKTCKISSVLNKFTHVHTLMAVAAMQGTDLLISSNLGLSILFKDSIDH